MHGQVICTKVRDGDKRIVRLKEGSPQGRHVVIVDDLVQSGGTLMECQKLIKSQVGPCQTTHSISVWHQLFCKPAPAQILATTIEQCLEHRAARGHSLQRQVVLSGGICLPSGVSRNAGAAQGAKHVSAYATHGVFPRDSWQRFTSANGPEEGFKYFWITDSCPRTVSMVKGQQPFEVLSLADPIAAALLI